MNRATILMYHLVDSPRSDSERRFCTTPRDFAEQVRWLSESGYTPLSIGQLSLCLNGQAPMPEKGIHITFDDGFACVLEHAAPILQQYGFPATMFALADRLGASNDWMSRRGFPDRSILSASGLLALSQAGFALGSHTSTHPSLPTLTPTAARDEIFRSKLKLEDTLGMPIEHFAYPYGHFTEAIREEVVRAGYVSACSTRSGFNRHNEDMYLLRRIDISGLDKMWQFRQKLTFGINEATRAYPLRYFAKRIAHRIGM